jgi:hypothetical protein
MDDLQFRQLSEQIDLLRMAIVEHGPLLDRIANALERQADGIQTGNFFSILAMRIVKPDDIRTQAIAARTAQGVFDRLQEQHEREETARKLRETMEALRGASKQ